MNRKVPPDRRKGPPPREPGSWLDQIDWGRAVRGASLGFTVLVLVGLLHPIVVQAGEPVGVAWLLGGFAVGFAVAAYRAGSATAPVPTGAAAALFGYLLLVPLIYLGGRQPPLRDILLLGVAAIVVGALVGYLVGRGNAA